MMKNEIDILRGCAIETINRLRKHLFENEDFAFVLMDKNRIVLEVIVGKDFTFINDWAIEESTHFDDELFLSRCHASILNYEEALIISKNDNKHIGYIYLVEPNNKFDQSQFNYKVGMLAEIITGNFELKFSDSYKDTILNSILDGIITVDEGGTITNINESACKMLELEPSKLIEKNITEVFSHDPKFVKIFLPQERLITDQQVFVKLPQRKNLKTFTVSSHCISLRNIGFEGRVIVLNEEKRTRKVIQQRAGLSARYTFNDILTEDGLFEETIELAKAAASSDTNIFLIGESGTGKEMFAQAIHSYSKRRDNPFVAINCAAIPKDLIGSELFGYVEGAFTGAQKGGSFGKFDLANEGTLFLDEIGDMPMDLQAVLLRAIEEKSIMRIGGKTKIPVNIRFIAATNKDYKKNIREDLFYRLSVFTINIIPLRNRKDDIIYFAKHYINKYSTKYKKEIDIDPRVFDALINYSWPGNVREMQNIIERMCAVVNDPGVISFGLLPQEILSSVKNNANNHNVVRELPLNAIQEKERDILEQLLQLTNGNISSVAKELGLARSTIYRKINKYCLDRWLSRSR